MEWSRWLIGVTEREEQCRFCCSIIKSGSPIVIEESIMEPECVLCHWERIRALVRKAKPKPKPKGDKAMPWKKVGGGKLEKWAEGMVVEGRIVRRYSNDTGPLMDFQDDKLGEIALSIPSQLNQQLEQCSPDARLRIVCGAKVPLGGGKSAWRFETFEDVPE